jgi:hypothetical protein
MAQQSGDEAAFIAASITQKVASLMEIARSVTPVASQRTVPDAFTWVVMSAARHISP